MRGKAQEQGEFAGGHGGRNGSAAISRCKHERTENRGQGQERPVLEGRDRMRTRSDADTGTGAGDRSQVLVWTQETGRGAQDTEASLHERRIGPGRRGLSTCYTNIVPAARARRVALILVGGELSGVMWYENGSYSRTARDTKMDRTAELLANERARRV